ncbi:hypothetical protein [Morganella morganii]|uniref:hypothetical protein n=1 Tax=Morganella morganii TaxID=582 RepID=UPI00052C285E|nr:hypothetical protein [Morganella morganii]KGP45251.1 hypothetical protein LR61_04340 [Morganella morganii]
MELTIPFSTIVMAFLGFLGVYILLPFALICRDFIILKLINKFLLSKNFYAMLSENTKAKACNNFIFAGRSLNMKFDSKDETIYIFGDKEISENEYHRLNKLLDKTIKTLDATTPIIQSKISRMDDIDKYYKLDAKLLDSLNDYVEKLYEREVNRLKNDNNVRSVVEWERT